MSKRRILIVMAHPDDESFGLGGLIAKYVTEGADVYLICSTNGDAGTIDPEFLDGYDSKAALRLAELDCAAEKLGFKEVFKLGYADSGMMGTPENDAPNASWRVWNERPEELTGRVLAVMQQVQPQVVITFNKFGGYGHPDHIVMHRATTTAFHQARQTFTNPPQKLYFTGFPKVLAQLRILMALLRGENPRKVGRNKDIDLLEIARKIEPVHTEIEIGDYIETWAAANACHASQGGGRSIPLSGWLRLLVGSKQRLTRAYPVPTRQRVDERDLFTGVSQEAEETVMA